MINRKAGRAALALLVAAAVPAFAQGAKTASAFYLEYAAAFDKAKSVDDLVPFMSKETQEQIKKASAEEKKQGFEMMKMMSATKVKVVKETATATGADLAVEGVSPMGGGKMTGTISVSKDGSAWRIAKESWKESVTAQ